MYNPYTLHNTVYIPNIIYNYTVIWEFYPIIDELINGNRKLESLSPQNTWCTGGVQANAQRHIVDFLGHPSRYCPILGGSSQLVSSQQLWWVNPLRIGLWDPFQMAFSWLINGGYYPLTSPGMILQVLYILQRHPTTSDPPLSLTKELGVCWYCWWFRNPVNSPVDMENLPLFTEFYTSQVVQEFWTINSIEKIWETLPTKVKDSQIYCIYPPPRIPVTTRIITFLGSGILRIPINLYWPLFLDQR